MADIFVSYSRADQQLVRRLARQLAEDGRQVWVDWEDIPPSARWMEEIRAAIEGSDTVVFVVRGRRRTSCTASTRPALRWKARRARNAQSNPRRALSPDSLASPVCLEEVGYALDLNKRVIPVVVRDPGEQDVPEPIAELQWIFFRQHDDFAAAWTVLTQALDTDLQWLKTHKRLLVRALEWQSTDDKSKLLRGGDLEDAEDALANRGDKAPAPLPIHGQYVVASRKAVSRRQRFTLRARRGFD